MPLFDYRCNDCGAEYDVFHKVREIAEDVICPSCGSKRHLRLMSAPAISGGKAPERSGGGGCCSGGACGYN